MAAVLGSRNEESARKHGIRRPFHVASEPQEEPYPHRAVHARTTDEVIEAERLGFDTAWIAEHHFATSYGIMPDCFAYMAYLAAKTSRIKIGAAVITLPLYDPIRVVENTSFVDILSDGRVRLGVGARAIGPTNSRAWAVTSTIAATSSRIDRPDVRCPASPSLGSQGQVLQGHRQGALRVAASSRPDAASAALHGGRHRPLDRLFSGRNGFGLMLSTLPSVETLAAQTALYKRELATASAERRKNPAAGEIDIARWVYIADTDQQARAETEEAIVRHISHFGGSGTGGYLGSVSEKGAAIKYDDLASTLLHGSAETVIARLREMQAQDRHDLAAAALSALLRTREDDEEYPAVRRARDPGFPSAGTAGGGGVTAATASTPNNTAPNKAALGPLLTMLAMLCFAGMDADQQVPGGRLCRRPDDVDPLHASCSCSAGSSCGASGAGRARSERHHGRGCRSRGR